MVADVLRRVAVSFVVARVACQANRGLVVGQHRRQSLDQRVAVIIWNAGVLVCGLYRSPFDDQEAGRRMRHGIRLLHCLLHSLSRSSRMRLTFEMDGT